VWQVGGAARRAWAGRRLRVPARNALLADVVPPAAYGRAYGFERMMDNLGAICDPAGVHEVVAALGVAAHQVEQTAGRLARFLEARLASGALSVHGDYAGDPEAAVTAATGRLEQVRLVARLLSGALEDAQAVTATIGPADEQRQR